MRKKYKLTAFSRLFIFMIFFAPLAYIGASYYNGEDGIAKIKALFSNQENITIQDQINEKKHEIETLTKKIESLQKDVDRLEGSKD